MVRMFSVIGDSFFMPLAYKNRDLNLQVILFLFYKIDKLEQNGENERTIIENRLSDCLDNLSMALVYDQDGEPIEDESSLGKAKYLIRRLITSRWLF